MPPVAFFDFDKTLLDCDSGKLFAIPGLREGIVGLGTAINFALTGLLYEVGLRSRAEIQRVGYSCYRGHKPEEIGSLMDEWFRDLMLPRLSPTVGARLRRHQEQGDVTVILSASPGFVVEPALRRLGVDGAQGTVMEVDSAGRCTGAPVRSLEGPAKADAAQEWMRQRGADPAECWAYSDSIHDLEMLEAVGHPVAVQPDAELARLAADRGWEILMHHLAS